MCFGTHWSNPFPTVQWPNVSVRVTFFSNEKDHVSWTMYCLTARWWTRSHWSVWNVRPKRSAWWITRDSGRSRRVHCLMIVDARMLCRVVWVRKSPSAEKERPSLIPKCITCIKDWRRRHPLRRKSWLLYCHISSQWEKCTCHRCNIVESYKNTIKLWRMHTINC